MNSFLLNRQLGSISPQTLAAAQNNRLLRSLQAAPDINFALTAREDDDGDRSAQSSNTRNVAHAAGVSSIAIDRFEGK